MSSKKKVWRGRSEYERLLAERDRKGWTLAELSRRSGVPESTLQRWSRRLRSERAHVAQPFVEVVAVEEALPADQVEVLLCSGRMLYLPARRPFPGLADLVTLLESC